jgi:coproporphyrinogen III oxidase
MNHRHALPQQNTVSAWFRCLRDDICHAFETLEMEASHYQGDAARFERTPWQRQEGGGGEMSLMRGRLFEKVGVNISTVYGEFSEAFRKEIPNADQDPRFWASGISLVAHMVNPHIPAVHMNTRMIMVGDGGTLSTLPNATGGWWFGGGADLNPMMDDADMAAYFHSAFKACCDAHHPDYYEKYTKWCDEYFFIKHRHELRGAGGIFYDYLKECGWDKAFAFTQEVGKTFLATYPEIVRARMQQSWSEADRAHQLFKRGRYTEFNLVYDRGTRFGLMTGGNPEAILMSLPPVATW